MKEISEFDQNGEHNDPEEESVGDENEPIFEINTVNPNTTGQRSLQININKPVSATGRNPIRVQEKKVGHPNTDTKPIVKSGLPQIGDFNGSLDGDNS